MAELPFDTDILVISPMAGAYRGRQLQYTVTHAYFNPETHRAISRAFCGYTPEDIDPYAGERLSKTNIPSCPRCQKKLEKYLTGATKTFPVGAGPDS